MNPAVEIKTTAGVIANMTTEQFVALRDHICADGHFEYATDPVRISGSDYIGVELPGIFIGIEKDGYTHS